jgi:hypothetical protein
MSLQFGVGIPITLLTGVYSYVTLKKGMKEEKQEGL